MDCEQNITIYEEGSEQQIDLNAENNEEQVQLSTECLNVVPFEDRDYNKSFNKPQINGVELIGNKVSEDIHVQHEMDEVTPQDIDNIIYA